MRIWLAGSWYTLPDHVLVVSLSDRDKRKIASMPKDYNLYCEFDSTVFDPEEIEKLLKRLKHES